MTILDQRTQERLRHGFRRYLNPWMLLLWRLGLGRWFNFMPALSGRVLVIVHTGRKTGRTRHTLVNFAEVDGELYCVAAFGPISDWYRNLLAQPEVEVWTPDGWWAATVEEISESDQRLLLIRQVLIGSGLVAYLFGLNPRRMPDAALEAASSDYRLLHLRRTEARTGPGGPGDLAWVWPLAAFYFWWLAARRRPRG